MLFTNGSLLSLLSPLCTSLWPRSGDLYSLGAAAMLAGLFPPFHAVEHHACLPMREGSI